MPGVGLEPTRPYGHSLLRGKRLPVTPPGLTQTASGSAEATPACTNRDLSLESGKRDSNPRPQPWQGCALPTELFPRAFGNIAGTRWRLKARGSRAHRTTAARRARG